MNLKDILKKYRDELKGIFDDQEIVAIFYLVSEHILNLNRAATALKMNDELSASDGDAFLAVCQELMEGKPVQYILGKAYFYGLSLDVNTAVLIPRPETEELVEMVIISGKKLHAPLRILDIGTGSGCIAIAVKTNLANAEVSALDVSGQALSVASQNAQNLGAEINFIQADIRSYHSSDNFDIIVSNPPYITEAEQELMDKHVTDFEPHLALFVADHHPLEFYEAIADFANTALSAKGQLFFEINAQFGKETAAMLEAKRFEEVLILQDMQGKDRFVKATKASSGSEIQ